jgi:hypothetical protein
MWHPFSWSRWGSCLTWLVSVAFASLVPSIGRFHLSHMLYQYLSILWTIPFEWNHQLLTALKPRQFPRSRLKSYACLVSWRSTCPFGPSRPDATSTFSAKNCIKSRTTLKILLRRWPTQIWFQQLVEHPLFSLAFSSSPDWPELPNRRRVVIQ